MAPAFLQSSRYALPRIEMHGLRGQSCLTPVTKMQGTFASVADATAAGPVFIIATERDSHLGAITDPKAASHAAGDFVLGHNAIRDVKVQRFDGP